MNVYKAMKKFLKMLIRNRKTMILISMIILIVGMIGYWTAGRSSQVQNRSTEVGVDSSADLFLTTSTWTPAEELLDGDEVEFAPIVSNQDLEERYVFVQLEMPSAYVVRVTEDGTKETVMDEPFFEWDILDGWVQVGDMEPNEDRTVFTYTYAYGSRETLSGLGSGEEIPLFENMTFRNIIGGAPLKEEDLTTNVQVYTVDAQTLAELSEGGTFSPEEIWEQICGMAYADQCSNEKA